jgi:hypothetical protein
MRYYSLFALLLFAGSTFSQFTQKMSYQAVIRSTDGELLRDSQVGIAISILQNDPEGTEVFRETHATTTNENGLVSIEIGNGNGVTGSIDLIDWASGPFYLKSETDPSGGTDYVLSATSELLSVPYALYAVSSGSGSGGGDSDWIEDIPNNEVRTSRNIAMQVGGSQPFRVNVDAPVGVARLESGSAAGIGVQGNTDMGYGVRGTAGQGVGVHGVARNFGDAVLGEAENGAGVHGKSDAYGVLGESELNHGVVGQAKVGYGVLEPQLKSQQYEVNQKWVMGFKVLP